MLIKFFKLSLKEKSLFFEALLLIYYAKIYLIFVPLKKWKIKMDKKFEYNNIDLKELKALKKAILRANKFSFWKNKCIVMCIASKFLLNRRKITSELHLSAKINNSKNLEAHAWLSVEDFQFISENDNFVNLI